MKWKDYFYYDRRDRNAILLLLVLVVVSVLMYTFCATFKTKPLTYQPQCALSVDTSYVSKLNKGEVVDLNKADTLLLKRIPGIGSVLANRIVKYRELLGGYVSISQLKEVWGIDEAMYENISLFLSIKDEPCKLRVNHLDYKDLIRHPYLNKEQVRVILDLSKRKRNLTSIKRLSLLEEFSVEDIKRLEPYLSFR